MSAQQAAGALGCGRPATIHLLLLLLIGSMAAGWSARSEAAASAPAFRDCDACPEMIAIPAGELLMGVAAGEEEREALGEEFRHRSEPRRRVRVPSFFASRHEVTRGQYRAFAEATGRGEGGCFFWNGRDYEHDAARSWRRPGYAQGEDHPVACVSWEDATAYAEWLSAKSGRRYRLLTEAEWEYAARGGTTGARYWDEGADVACRFANGADLMALQQAPEAVNWPVASCSDGYVHTAPVGSFRPNAFGLHDMLGNVWEWTQDCWNGDYRSARPDAAAATTGDCGLRVVRGGSWDDSPAALRAAYRVGSPVVIRVYGRGFRLAH